MENKPDFYNLQSEEKGSISPNKQQIVIDRVRHFLEFKTPSFLSVSMEITLSNKGSRTSYFIYDLADFKSGLHIFDSDGKPLEFNGNKEADKGKREIIIYFPQDRQFCQNDYRTITFEYVQRFKLSEARQIMTTFTLYKGSITYIFVKQCDEYDFKIDIFECLDSDELVIERRIASEHISEQREFFELPVALDDSNDEPRNLLVLIEHKTPKSLLYWYYMGSCAGISASILVPIAYHFDPSHIHLYIIVASTCISFLIIIKGWLFNKSMDRTLKKLDTLYIVVVLFLFLEILLLIFDSSSYFAFKLHLPQLCSFVRLLLIESVQHIVNSILFFLINTFQKLFI